MSSVFEDFAREITEEVTKEVTRNNLLTSVKALMQNLNLTAEQAMDGLNVPMEDWDEIKRGVATP